jgi:hypothetical protein
MEPVYSSDELVTRIWDKENVVQTINRHSYLNSYDLRREELDTLWVRQPDHRATASLAYNNGYYVGMEEIARHYVAEREQLLYQRLEPYCQASGAEPSSNDLGLGAGCMQTSTTPLVYLADDGKSARYLGYRLGYQATGKPDGTADAYLDFGLIFCDLLKEDGQWKIWHLVLEHDHTVTVGEDYAKVPVRLPFGEDPLEREFGVPTQEQTVYAPLFGWEYLYQDMPKPYLSYEEKSSYGPNGDLGKPYYQRERR